MVLLILKGTCLLNTHIISFYQIIFTGRGIDKINFEIQGVLKSEFDELQKKYPDCSDNEIFFNLMYRLEISRILYDAMNITLDKGHSFVTIDEIIQALSCRQKLDFANMPFNEFLDNMRKEILASTYYHFNMNDDDKKSYTS